MVLLPQHACRCCLGMLDCCSAVAEACLCSSSISLHPSSYSVGASALPSGSRPAAEALAFASSVAGASQAAAAGKMLPQLRLW